MKPETLKQILSERHPHINLNSSEMELVFHYLKEWHKEQDKVIDIIITYLKGMKETIKSENFELRWNGKPVTYEYLLEIIDNEWHEGYKRGFNDGYNEGLEKL